MTTSSTKSLSCAGLIKTVRYQFLKVTDPREFKNGSTISLTDILMSGFAMFSLKFPSLLQFDRKRSDIAIQTNLRNLYGVKQIPSDTYLRERLDELNSTSLRPAFKKVFAAAQRGKVLESFQFINGHYLLSLDGTGQLSSGKVACKHCCKKVHKNGQVTYYHQMLGACIVHPDRSNVIPLCPEAIKSQDGNAKNDCERNASKRLIENFRKEHPHLKVIVVEDGLASNGPHIELLQQHRLKFILGAKPGDHKHLFSLLENSDEAVYHELKDDKGSLHQFRFLNDVPLNKSHPELLVNVLEYRETTSKGTEINFSWVTNIRVTSKNAYELMRGGRARWKIENETYNTLKNLGYNFEHNYGHGKQYLATVFCLLMMLAFLIDQIQEIACGFFQMAKGYAGTYRGLWERMRLFFEYFELTSWELFYRMIAKSKPPNST